MTHLLRCKVINWYACPKFFGTANADAVRFGRRVRFVPWSTVRTDLATTTR